MNSPTAARFEFRVWAGELAAVGDRVRELAEPREVRESAETYFVATSTVDVNAKARADLLDIKVLKDVRERCEQWDVHRKVGFPVESAVVETELFGLFGLTAPALDRAAYSLSELVDEVVALRSDVTAVEVTKRRQMHDVDACSVEFADVTIDGRAVQTVAVESVDLAAVQQVRRMLGLDGHDNVSYPRAIRDMLGGRSAER